MIKLLFLGLFVAIPFSSFAVDIEKCKELQNVATKHYERLISVINDYELINDNQPQISLNLICSDSLYAGVDHENNIQLSLGNMMSPLNLTEEELASIIAHELGHVINQTPEERLSKYKSWNVDENNRRALESEDMADITALKLLSIAGYNPKSLLTAFKKEKQINGNKVDNKQHRNMRSRIRFIRRQLIFNY